MTGNLKIISDLRIRYILSKGHTIQISFPYRFKKSREAIASALNDFGNRWCKQEYLEPNALKEWKVSIFKIVDQPLLDVHDRRIKVCTEQPVFHVHARSIKVCTVQPFLANTLGA